MTALILAQKKFMMLKPVLGVDQIQAWFYKINAGGNLTLVIALACALSITVYMGGLYFASGAGFEIKGATKNISRLETEVLKLEFKVEATKTAFAKDSGFIVESMDQISNIKYLTAESFVASAVTAR